MSKQFRGSRVWGLNFARTLLLTCVGVLCLAAGFNWAVNPYRLYRGTSAETSEGLRPRPMQMQHEFRTALARRVKADVLVIGNSRMEIGVNPDAPELRSLGKTLFNLGVAGARISEASQGLSLILQDKRPSRVIIGVDFYEFIADGPRKGSGANFPQFDDHFSGKAKLHGKSLLTLEALSDSIKTLAIPYRSYPQTLNAWGHNPMLDFEGHARTSGYRVLFDTGNVNVRNEFSNGLVKARALHKQGSQALDDLTHVIDFLRKNGIEISLVMYPVHHDFQALVLKSGLWQEFEDWKETIVRLAEEKGKGATPIEVFDFGCTGAFVNEKIPAAGDKTTVVASFWDSGHFKASVGSQMILRVLSPGQPGLNEGLTGYRLSSSTVRSHHPLCRASVDKYVEKQ